jgi:hypothetical protein
MNTKQIEEGVVKDAFLVVNLVIMAWLVAVAGRAKLDSIDRELDAAERAAAVPTHPNFGRARK